MAGERLRYSAEFNVALEALKGDLTAAEQVAKHGVSQTLIHTSKRRRPTAKRSCRSCTRRSASWSWNMIFTEGLRKMSVSRRREMIDPAHPRFSIRQCRLVAISRSAFYGPAKGESPLNLALMRLIDEQFLGTP